MNPTQQQPTDNMQTTLRFLFVSLLAAAPFWLHAARPTADAPTEFVVGISPFMPAEARPQVLTALAEFVLTDCPNGARFAVWDGWELKTVCDLRSERLTYDSPVARANSAAPALASVRQWFLDLKTRPVPDELRNSWAVNIPEFLQAATAEPEAGRRSIIIWGSPIYRSMTEPSFSMLPDRYPSDSNLSRSVAETPFGVTESHSRLTNTTVFWLYPSENIWVSGRHRYLVERWWSLFIAAQSGVLASFSSDAPEVLQAATRPVARLVGSFAINPRDAEVVMHASGKREIVTRVEQPHAVSSPTNHPPVFPPIPAATTVPAPKPVTAPAPQRTATVPEKVAKAAAAPTAKPPQGIAAVQPAPPLAEPRPLVHTNAVPASPQPPRAVTPAPVAVPAIPAIPQAVGDRFIIAAIWWTPEDQAGRADIDLYVSADGGRSEASWRQPYAWHARHFRDIRRAKPVEVGSAQWQLTWEYAELVAEPSAVSVWVNVYLCRAPVRGVVRVQWRGRTVDQPFAFDLTRGNGGRDSDLASRRHSPYWQEVRLDALFPAASLHQGAR